MWTSQRLALQSVSKIIGEKYKAALKLTYTDHDSATNAHDGIVTFGSDVLAHCSISSVALLIQTYPENFKEVWMWIENKVLVETLERCFTETCVIRVLQPVLFIFSYKNWCLWSVSGLTQRQLSVSSNYQKKNQRCKYEYYCLKPTEEEKLHSMVYRYLYPATETGGITCYH